MMCDVMTMKINGLNVCTCLYFQMFSALVSNIVNTDTITQIYKSSWESLIHF